MANVETPTKSVLCASCSQPALFLTPVGQLCSDHAMRETLRQVADDSRWMPVPISR